jgi:hypothetical protein
MFGMKAGGSTGVARNGHVEYSLQTDSDLSSESDDEVVQWANPRDYDDDSDDDEEEDEALGISDKAPGLKNRRYVDSSADEASVFEE